MLINLYKKLPYSIKKTINKLILKVDHGEMLSYKIRKIFKEVYGIDVGIGTYGCFDVDRIAPNIVIGNYCSFAQGVSIVPRREHPINYVSTHPFFFNSDMGWVKNSRIPFNNLVIGNDVWIGRNAIISSKCTNIGNGAVIGAGSFVNRDVPPYAVIAGVPARIIKYRFDDDIISLIEKTDWYNIPMDVLKKYANDVNDPVMFTKKIMEYRSKYS